MLLPVPGDVLGLESRGRAAVVTTRFTRSLDASDDSERELMDRRLDPLPFADDSPAGIRSSRTSEGRLSWFFSKNAKRFHLDDAMAALY